MTRQFASRQIGSTTGVDTMMAASDAGWGEGIINLSLGDPDMNTDQAVIEAAFRDVKRGFTHYEPALGSPELIAAIQTTWHEDLALSLGDKQIMVTTSGCHALWLLLSAILDPGDEVVIFTPYFPPYPNQVQLARGIPVVVNTNEKNGFVPQASKLNAALSTRTKAVLVNTPCNPTGTCLTKNQMQPLMELCHKKGLLLIADDIYTNYSFNTPFTAFAQLDQNKGYVATIRSFSKDFCMSGWRLGYVVAPTDVIAAMQKINESNVFVAPTPSQRAALHALRDRARIQAKIHKVYGARMAYALKRIKAIPYLAAPSTQGSLYVFLDIRKTGLTSTEFAHKLLQKEKVLVIPGEAFGSAGAGFIRLALREDLPVLEQVFDGLERVAKV